MKSFKVFKNKNFTKLFLASFASKMGSTIGMTAFVFYLLHRFSEQPFYASLNEMMFSLPTLFLFLIVGVAADRMDRQKIAINSDWIRAVLSLGLSVCLLGNQIFFAFLFVFLRESVSKFFYPAEQAIVQGVLSKDEYTIAAGLNQMTMSLFMLFGNALGILAFWSLGIEGAILVDALSFCISALLIHSCKLDQKTKLPNGLHYIKDLNLGIVLSDFQGGFIYIFQNKLLTSLILGFLVFGVVNGGFSVMPVYILKYKLAPDSYETMSIWFGLIFGGGILIGSILATMVADKFKSHYLLIVGIFFSGICTIFASFQNQMFSFYLAILGIALSLPFVNIAIGGWLPKIVDPKFMGRVQGWTDPLMMFSQTVTLGFISVLFPTYLSVNGLFWIVGGCLILVAFYYLMILPRQVRLYEISNKGIEASPHSEKALF